MKARWLNGCDMPGKHGTTVIYDAFSPHGEIPVSPSPRDATSEERHAKIEADKIHYRPLLAMFDCDDQDFNQAVTFGFPKSRSRSFGGRFNCWVFGGRKIDTGNGVIGWGAC